MANSLKENEPTSAATEIGSEKEYPHIPRTAVHAVLKRIITRKTQKVKGYYE